MTERWRVGSHYGIHLYRQVGPDPSDGDEPVGTMLRPEWAAIAVEAVNGRAGLVPLADILAALRDRKAWDAWIGEHWEPGWPADVRHEQAEIAAKFLAERFAGRQGDAT